jgi:peptide/nickel transport system substrate-binding protein
LRQSAVFIQSALDEAGVDVEINELSEADFNSNLGKMQMYIDSWYSWGQDSVYQMFFLLTTGLFTNYTNYSNPEVDELVKQAMETTDPDERHRLSQEAQQLIIDDAPWAFLFTRDVLVGAQANVEGITHSNDANLRFDRLRVTN